MNFMTGSIPWNEAREMTLEIRDMPLERMIQVECDQCRRPIAITLARVV